MDHPVLDGVSLPEPLKAAEIGTFTHYSVVERLPNIVQRTIDENSFPPHVEERLRALAESIPRGQIRHLIDRRAPDALDWQRYIEEHDGQTWLDVPWFFAETYFYRRMLEATGYFEMGAMQSIDPFEYQKRRGLETARAELAQFAAKLVDWEETIGWNPETFTRLLTISLWGNQSDLSLWPAGEDGPGADREPGSREMIIVDDARRAAEHLMARSDGPVRVDFLGDNAGFELITDLALIDYLLTSGVAGDVHMHLKAHPTFVSDAMDEDVYDTVAFLTLEDNEAVQTLGKHLRGHLDAGRLILREDFYWNSPVPLWGMPRTLQDEMINSHLVLSKGDANYRRLLGDRHWTFTEDFERMLAYFPPPLLAVRACKSEVAIGLKPGQAPALSQRDPDWMTNGEWGMIQFKPATKGLPEG